jgi:hypothetical protein
MEAGLMVGMPARDNSEHDVSMSFHLEQKDQGLSNLHTLKTTIAVVFCIQAVLLFQPKDDT